jgi:hypothetical protein
MRRVQTFLMFLTVSSALAPSLAWAQPPVVAEPTSTARFTGATTGSGRGFGIGAAAVATVRGTNDSVPNILATWGDSAGRFHVEGLVGLRHYGTTGFDIGVRGWYHLHAASSADFSLGGGFALLSNKANVPGSSRQTDFALELGAQIRAFVVPNVALLGSVGMRVYIPDSGDSDLLFSGDLTGALGIAYFFM